MTSKSVFSAEQLTVSYGQNTVLWDISFELEGPGLIGIIGPNGAGKSTLLKSALGIVHPLSGYALFWNQPFKKVRKRVAYVPQRGQIDWDFPMTVFQVALMGRYQQMGLLKWARRADKEATFAILEKLGLVDFAERQISELSGGQQQRLFLARALLQEADIYLFDEPFSGVDLSTEGLIMEQLRELKDDGKTSIIVHHNLNSVESYFDSVIILNTSLVACGPTKDVFTAQNLSRAFGSRGVLLEEVVRLAREKSTGLK